LLLAFSLRIPRNMLLSSWGGEKTQLINIEESLALLLISSRSCGKQNESKYLQSGRYETEMIGIKVGLGLISSALIGQMPKRQMYKSAR